MISNNLRDIMLCSISVLLIIATFSCKKIEEEEVIIDEIKPEISIISPVNNSRLISSLVEVEWEIVDDNYRSAFYKINNGETIVIINPKGKNTHELECGDYNISLTAKDIKSNISVENVFFTVIEDTIPPVINVVSPISGKVYETNDIVFEWDIEEHNFISAWYEILNFWGNKFDGGVIDKKSGKISKNIPNGLNKLIIGVEDKYGNTATDTVLLDIRYWTGKYLLNPFVQPNDSTLNWYGSGDVDGNNKVDQNDVTRLDQIVAGTFVPNLESDNPVEYRTLDRADVTGDGMVDALDRQTLQEKINGTREYLPGEWNKLKTRAEREEWFQKIKKINQSSSTFPILGVNICTAFSWQTAINFYGAKNMGFNGSFEYGGQTLKLRDNGRFNFPMLIVSITGHEIDIAHAMNAFIIGDDVRIFSDWYLFEPQALHINRSSNDWALNFPYGCTIHFGRSHDFSFFRNIITYNVIDNKERIESALWLYQGNSQELADFKVITTRDENNSL